MAKLVAVTPGEPPKARSNGQLGKYRLVATLGQGGMGTVHLAYASGLGQFRKLLVVKELRQDLVWKDTSVSMFMDEARLAARLDHPNVVQTFEADEDAGRYFIAMEYLDGQPLSALAERMRARGGLPLPFHLHVLCEALNGLHYAHELRDYDGTSLHVVHRDVSPQNVFVTFHGQVKVVDFGVAKARNASTFTTPGVFKGKFAYAAPEQAFGRPVDARADVFAVGVMLWEAIAGRRYSDQNPTPESFQARLSGAEPNIREIVPGVDAELARICDRALAHEPTERYRSAAALRADLQSYLHSTGQRVDPAQIAHVMQEVFQKERVVMHRVVERAMMEEMSSPGVDSTPPTLFLHSDGEKELTMLADLTDLAEVSHHTDDNKIRAGYEVSKVTQVKRGASGEHLRTPSPLLWAGLGLSLAAAGLSIWLWYTRQASPPTAAVAGHPKPTAPASLAAPGQAALTAPVAETPSASKTQRASAKAEVNARPSPSRRVRSAAPTRSRPTPTPVAAVAAPPTPAQPPARAEAPQPSAAKPLEPTMGSDLSVTRRAPGGRIDVEDPYQ